MQYFDFFEEVKGIRDLNGLEPWLYLITTNRGPGKTTNSIYQGLKCGERGKQAVYMYRVKAEAKSLHLLFESLPYAEMKIEKKYTFETINAVKDVIFAVLGTDVETGEKRVFAYALAINDREKIKKYSNIFKDVELIFFDELIPENGRYLANEVESVQSVIASIARGHGAHSRPVKCFLFGNNISIINPYFVHFGIHKRLRDNTKIIRGNRWVAIFGFYKESAREMSDNPVLQAFGDTKYNKMLTAENVYLNDNKAFIQKMSGNSRYYCTILDSGVKYAVRIYESNIVYVDYTADPSCDLIVTFNNSDHSEHLLLLPQHGMVYDFLKYAYSTGVLRFKDAQCKNMIFDILSIEV